MQLDLNREVQFIEGGKEKREKLSYFFSSSDLVLFYFYPKDNTPGCSVEAHDFSLLKDSYSSIGINIVGISKDSLSSHKDFIDTLCITFPLISDDDLVLHKELGAYGEKNNYGKIITGVLRSTFLINKTGEVVKSWINVKATGHAEKLLKELKK